jgi:hypothetical protein
MRTVTCPGCGRSGKIPDSYTGARAKCPKCATTMDVPGLDDDEPETIDLGIEVGEPGVAPPGPVTPDASWVAPAAAAASSRLARLTRPAPGRLPWFYGFLHLLAMMGVACGVLAWGVGFTFGLSMATQTDPRTSATGVALAMYSIGVGVGMLVVPSLILLALDAAKTLRAVRDRLPD